MKRCRSAEIDDERGEKHGFPVGAEIRRALEPYVERGARCRQKRRSGAGDQGNGTMKHLTEEELIAYREGSLRNAKRLPNI